MIIPLPDGWKWVRFGNIFTLEYGKNLPKTKRTNSGEYPVYGSNGVAGTHNEFCIDQPCIVVGRKGSAGALNLRQTAGCWVTDVAYSVIPPSGIDLRFTLKLFHTLNLDRLGKGIKPGLNRNEANILYVPIPPLAEQHRIVAKVDELMALCDQLEQQQADHQTTHQTLVETLLNGLVESATLRPFDKLTTQDEKESTERPELVEGDASTSSAQAADYFNQLIAEHFDTLFTTEQSIDQLKQTILQLAVMGKLVPQDPKNEPASMLLEKIAVKRQRLVEEDGLKTKASLVIELKDEYVLKPSGWQFIRLGNLAKFIDYRGRTPKKIESGVPLITAKNVRYGFISREPYEFISEEEYEGWMTRGFPRLGDILFTTEAPLGNVALIDINEKFALAQRVICFQLHEISISAFLKVLIMSGLFRE
jgi:type I restriction enzyme S subunit